MLLLWQNSLHNEKISERINEKCNAQYHFKYAQFNAQNADHYIPDNDFRILMNTICIICQRSTISHQIKATKNIRINQFKHFTLQWGTRDQPICKHSQLLSQQWKKQIRYQKNNCLVCTCADTGWECRHCLLLLLSLDALACESVPASVYFHWVRVKACISSWACEYARASVPPLNAQPFPRAGVCGTKSKGVWLYVCINTDLQAECRPKHNSGSRRCPS